MKFIFPQNYNFRNKFLGIIDYSIVFINLIWYGIIFILVNIIFNNLNFKIWKPWKQYYPYYFVAYSLWYRLLMHNIMVMKKYILLFFSVFLYFYSRSQDLMERILFMFLLIFLNSHLNKNCFYTKEEILANIKTFFINIHFKLEFFV